MSSKTTNFNLHKIDLTDAPPDITVLNQNWDAIDAALVTADKVLIAEYNVTPFADINNAVKAGKIVICNYGGMYVQLSEGITGLFYTFIASDTTSQYVISIDSAAGWAMSDYDGYLPRLHASAHKSTGSDPITPDDIKAAAQDMSNVDLDALMTAMGTAKIVTGAYTGSGSGTQSINLGSQPKAVFVIGYKYASAKNIFYMAMPSFPYNGYTYSTGSTYSNSLIITSTGFDAAYSGTNGESANESGYKYGYVAII